MTSGYRIEPIGTRYRRAALRRGRLITAAALAEWGVRYAAGSAASVALAGRAGRFELGGRSYDYLRHRHKFTWLTERTVEVPVALAMVEQERGPVLEVGHVLGHYAAVSHEIVDKYERAPGVRNVDVLELDAAARYALIVSVSTLEHVGVDDAPRDPRRAVEAVHHLRSLLAPGGRLFATVPVGYNPALDEAIRERAAPFDCVQAMTRAGRGRRWREITPTQAWSEPYDELLFRARAVLFCTASAHARSASRTPIAVSDTTLPQR